MSAWSALFIVWVHFCWFLLIVTPSTFHRYLSQPMLYYKLNYIIRLHISGRSLCQNSFMHKGNVLKGFYHIKPFGSLLIHALCIINRVIVIAGDTSPIEVVCHMPLVCEEGGIPYCYTPSKEVCQLYEWSAWWPVFFMFIFFIKVCWAAIAYIITKDLLEHEWA